MQDASVGVLRQERLSTRTQHTLHGTGEDLCKDPCKASGGGERGKKGHLQYEAGEIRQAQKEGLVALCGI